MAQIRPLRPSCSHNRSSPSRARSAFMRVSRRAITPRQSVRAKGAARQWRGAKRRTHNAEMRRPTAKNAKCRYRRSWTTA